MRILMTGGAGFIGQHLARLLAPRHELVALDLLSPQVHLDPEASRAAFPGVVVVGDVSDPAAWEQLDRADVIIHLAAETGTGQSMYESDRYRRVNVEGTRLAGETARAWGSALISLSSRAVYGNGRTECEEHGTAFGASCCDRAVPAPSTEDDLHVPVSVYGETKSEGEAVLEPVAATVPATILRPQNVVGPGQALHNPYTGVLAGFVARLREGLPLTVYGDGTATRDFLHVKDLSALIAWAVDHPPEPGTVRVLNAGTGVRTTLDELAVTAAAGSPLGTAPIEYLPVTRVGDIEHAVADLTRLDQLGAPRPRRSSRDAITDFIRWAWDKPGAAASSWDDALAELSDRGLTS